MLRRTWQCSFDATNNAVNERALYQHGAEGNGAHDRLYVFFPPG